MTMTDFASAHSAPAPATTPAAQTVASLVIPPGAAIVHGAEQVVQWRCGHSAVLWFAKIGGHDALFTRAVQLPTLLDFSAFNVLDLAGINRQSLERAMRTSAAALVPIVLARELRSTYPNAAEFLAAAFEASKKVTTA